MAVDKVWHETWEECAGNVVFPDGTHLGERWDSGASARLASAAPEMARLLVEIYNRANDPLQDRIVEALEKAGVITVARARGRLV